MSGFLQEDPVVEFEEGEDTEERELDLIEQLFLQSGPEATIIIHFGDCVATEEDEDSCTCERLVLQRGARA